MTIKYFDTLYRRETTVQHVTEVQFVKEGIRYKKLGCKYFIEYEYVRSIKEENEA